MRRYLGLAFTALIFASAGAMAQPAAETPPPETRIQAAIDLLKANHTIDNMNATMDVLMPQMTAQLKRQAPGLSDAAIATFIQKIRDVVMSRQDELLRLYGIEYARHFSEQELRDLAGFYRSDLGKKYIAEVPTIVKESAPITTRWMVGVITQEQQKIMDSLPKPDKKT